VAERKEVRLAGAGHHGMIQAGLILQEAAAIYDDLNAHHVQSYGPEARSNHARSEVIISDGDIDYPKATQIDVMVATTNESVERYAGDMKGAGVLIVEEALQANLSPGVKAFRLPLMAIAEKSLGKPNLMHIVALGAVVELSKVVTKAAIEQAVKDHVAKGSEEIHQKALEAGYKLAASSEAR
jgi:2-oxoglutarate ferredoxin oxidoreductase subunit gamma